MEPPKKIPSQTQANRDVSRIAEQLNAQLSQRPAVAFFTSMEASGSAGRLSRQVAEKMSSSGSGGVLWLDADLFASQESGEATCQLDANAESPALSDLEGKIKKRAGRCDTLAVRSGAAGTDSERGAAVFQGLLMSLKGAYSLIVVGGFSVKEDAIFSAVAASDFCVVGMKQGVSSRREFEAFVEECGLISGTRFGAVLEVEAS